MAVFGVMHGMHGMAAGSGDGSSASIAGIQTATEAILHVAGLDPLPFAGIEPLTPGSAANMKRWSPDIRAFLLQNAVSRHVGHAADDAASYVSLTWNSAAVATLKPPTAATMAKQCDIVRYYADQRSDRGNEILSQLGSFPPYFAVLLGLTAGRNPKTLELLDAVQSIAGQITMLPKHLFACRRPDELDARVRPLIMTPSHGSFPSAHATQAIAMARVLEGLILANPLHFGDAATRIDLCYRQAHRMAVNRTVAGVHFPMDSAAGSRLGLQIGNILVAMMTGGGTVHEFAVFDPDTLPDADFLYDDAKALRAVVGGAEVAVAPEPLMAWLWGQASYEFSLHAAI